MWLSILGMYEYDNSIFDDLNVPDGINKENVINNILLNCAELEIVYSEIETMRLGIKIWSDSNQITWKKLFDTMTVEYNPIWNVDANIREERIRDGSLNRQVSTDENFSNTDTKSVKGFNETGWADSERNIRNGTDATQANENVTDADNEVFTSRRTGNIGVTATQDLIQKEREIAVFNMIEFITESFKKRFCLMIY